ncbi:MAG: hypothetical protein CFE25_01740 [Chitinophagaceae bacterium BSSC1]|nr:MAG: hypothetical protein CFE25_01740 [Chitinophagaceae bacterium BSSC1]
MNRNVSLDYLRGISAIGIMIYHFGSWSYGLFDSSTILSRIGIYGVTIFYILSGATLYQVYSKNILLTSKHLCVFYLKRIARIFPLLWLVNIFTIVVDYNSHFNLKFIFLNFTGLFGFLSWDQYIATGAWSIGNELVFYFLFPIFIYFSNLNLKIFLLLTLFLIYFYFSFLILKPDIPISQQWYFYTNPLNHVFMFYCGMLISTYKVKDSYKKGLIYLFLVGIIIFIFLPVEGYSSNLVFGTPRLLFSFSALLIVLFFVNTNFKLNKRVEILLASFGEYSYSIYMFHPIMYLIVYKFFNLLKFSNAFIALRLSITIVLTLIFSRFVYLYFERRITDFIKNRIN